MDTETTVTALRESMTVRLVWRHSSCYGINEHSRTSIALVSPDKSIDLPRFAGAVACMRRAPVSAQEIWRSIGKTRESQKRTGHTEEHTQTENWRKRDGKME